MTLIEAFELPCVLMEKTRVPDGEGGWTAEWAEGAPFMAAITSQTGTLARIAEAQGVTNVFTVTTARNLGLDFHDVFRRLDDGDDYSGMTFRVTTANPSTPDVASFQFSQVQAEEWSLT